MTGPPVAMHSTTSWWRQSTSNAYYRTIWPQNIFFDIYNVTYIIYIRNAQGCWEGITVRKFNVYIQYMHTYLTYTYSICICASTADWSICIRRHKMSTYFERVKINHISNSWTHARSEWPDIFKTNNLMSELCMEF